MAKTKTGERNNVISRKINVAKPRKQRIGWGDISEPGGIKGWEGIPLSLTQILRLGLKPDHEILILEGHLSDAVALANLSPNSFPAILAWSSIHRNWMSKPVSTREYRKVYNVNYREEKPLNCIRWERELECKKVSRTIIYIYMIKL